MKPHSDDMEGWLDLGLIAGVFFGLGFLLLVVEVFRLPARIWRLFR